MKSHVLFKPYLYAMSAVGISLAVWQLLTVPMGLDLSLLFIIIFNTAAECIEYYYFDTRTSLTFGAANMFFMMMFFPFSSVVLACILAVLAQAYFRKKNGVWDKIINHKTIFNLSMYVIYNYVTYLGLRLLGIVLPGNVFILGMMILLQNMLNGLLVFMVQSLAVNKFAFQNLYKNMFVFYLSMVIMTLMLIYNYYYIGIWAVIGIFFIFIMAQSSMQLAVDNSIKDEKIYKDSMTGVYNKEYFIKTIEEKLKNKRKFSIIMLDMDGFKEINDKYGHLAGDKSLQEFVNKIRKLLRKEDLLYRYGGDEFAIIVADGDAAAVVERKLYMGRFMIHHKGAAIDIRFSTGIYNCTGSETSYEAIFEKVDAAMYEAKQKGGNQSAYAAADEFKLY